MNVKLYLVVKCDNEGIQSVQSFSKQDVAEEIFRDNVEAELYVSKEEGYYMDHTARKNYVKFYYEEGYWAEIKIVEDEVFVEV